MCSRFIIMCILSSKCFELIILFISAAVLTQSVYLEVWMGLEAAPIQNLMVG